ncbi:ribulose bisphosphate carboxylase small subunit [Azospirillum sp. CT11-132]|jgi:ribulose-bisphosphate carboxylase small chain|uniref:ribulose bisphosphate carboxylase small subunit n=1 Tax=unclassified Azospirillum TaxID=2630922 RepID=UPI000D605CC2|nr:MULTISPECIES: ribulose bisphosphate carboxylase small subunit [unclassified Azospirillum]PWC62619.1 ribulose 1,5-bisphosphate carboxylase small subunit [Azospirillum sp. TSH7]PWC65496.1 ribulose 1,5-bisphosphate carboxylase small subunit [Azospirillum sp. TSH20]QCG93724.1 ribulose bisphosphate carboxylase small subunit [Azospirillum sp. TSA2s]
MHLTQGQFSFLPDLTDEEITKQVQYALDQGWAVAVEFTDDPHPRNSYWTMWGNPMFDLRDAKGVMMEIDACRTAHPDQYVKVLAFDSSHGFETVRMSYLVNRPAVEPGFELLRAEGPGRRIGYTVRSYATGRPSGERYGGETRHGT